MKSLRDLNQTSLLQVTFEDDRPSGVEFYPDPPQATVFVDITENSEFYPDTGTNVISVVDFANARVKYKLDFSSWPVPVTVDWEDVAPDHPTISFSEISSNVWEIEGIDSDSVWNVVKSPVVYSPFGLSGVYTFVSTISYYAADGVTLLTKTWNTQVDIQDVTYMSEPVQQHYVPYAIGDAIPAPSVVVDLVVFNPTFTLNISASNLDSVEAIRVTGNDSAVFTSTTDTLTIVGEKDEINDALATLEIDFAGVNENFVLTYRLTNDLNSNVEIVTQDFESDGELASGFTVQTTLVTEPVVFHIVRGASATVAEFSNRASLQYVVAGAADVQSDFEVVPNESVEWHGKPVAQQVEAIIPAVDSFVITDAWTIPGPNTDNFYANTLNQQITNAPSIITDLSGPWRIEIGPDSLDVDAISGITEIYTTSTQATTSYTSSTATLVLIGTDSEIQDALDNLYIDYNNNNKANWSLYFDAEYNSSDSHYIYTHQMIYKPSVIVDDSTFIGNVVNTPFTAIDIAEPGYTTWSITLTVDLGELYDQSTLSKSVTISGTESQVEQQLFELEYYPDYNQTQDATITYTSTKDARTSDNGTMTLAFTYTGTIDDARYNLFGDVTSYTPTIEEFKYGKMSYALVGGGGGAAGVYFSDEGGVTPAWEEKHHTIVNNGSVAKDSNAYKFGDASGRFPGNVGDYLTWTDLDEINDDNPDLYNVGFYFNLDSVVGTQVLYEKFYPDNLQSMKIQVVNSDLEVVVSNYAGITYNHRYSNSISADTWHHFWLVGDKQNGSTDGLGYGVYLDGVRFAAYTTTDLVASSGVKWKNTLGADRNGSNQITGYIDEFCIGAPLFDLFDSSNNFSFPPANLTVPGANDWAKETQATHPDFDVLYNGTTVKQGNGEIVHIDFNLYDFDEIIDDKAQAIKLIISNYPWNAGPTGGGGQIVFVQNDTVDFVTYTATLGEGGLSAINKHKRHGEQGGSTTFRNSTALGGFGATPLASSADVSDNNQVYYAQTSAGTTALSTFGATARGGDYGGYNDGYGTNGEGGSAGGTVSNYAGTGGGPGDAFSSQPGVYEDGYDSLNKDNNSHPLPESPTTTDGKTVGRLSGSGTPLTGGTGGQYSMIDAPLDEPSVLYPTYATGTIPGKGADSNYRTGLPGGVAILIHAK